MKFLDIAKSRYSVRKYKQTKVESDKLNKILEAAHVAPTAANLQPVRLFVIQDENTLAKLGKAANIYNAPLAIVVCSDHTKAWNRPFDGKSSADIDASIITDHMMLEATDLGLGSVWICYFKPDVLKKELNLPEKLEPINILAIGYADETPASPNRHSEQRISLNKLATFM
ncbi:MAG: nitroreductase family protein [Lachnospiraceae bacterium]|nr:nitroreductase family protein [Lachnospiraceae bacterium]